MSSFVWYFSLCLVGNETAPKKNLQISSLISLSSLLNYYDIHDQKISKSISAGHTKKLKTVNFFITHEKFTWKLKISLKCIFRQLLYFFVWIFYYLIFFHVKIFPHQSPKKLKIPLTKKNTKAIWVLSDLIILLVSA